MRAGQSPEKASINIQSIISNANKATKKEPNPKTFKTPTKVQSLPQSTLGEMSSRMADILALPKGNEGTY